MFVTSLKQGGRTGGFPPWLCPQRHWAAHRSFHNGHHLLTPPTRGIQTHGGFPKPLSPRAEPSRSPALAASQPGLTSAKLIAKTAAPEQKATGEALWKSQFPQYRADGISVRKRAERGRGEGAERVPDDRSAGANLRINSQCRHLLRNTFPAPH